VATPTDLTDLKRKSVRGGAVSLASQGASLAIHTVSTVVLARLLTPDDFGIVAMVGAVTAFAGVFRDLGLSAAAIQMKDLTHAQQSTLFWVNVATGAMLTGGLAAASPIVAWFYGKSELITLTIALSLSFLIASFGTQHGASLARNLQFGRLAVATLSGAVVGLAVSIGLAFYGARYWALVWGGLAGGLTGTLLRFCLSEFRPNWPTRGTGMRKMLRFGANVTGFDVVNYFARNLDNILIGRVWGDAVLGLYSRAYALLMFPIHNLRNPIQSVAFPAMSKLQHDPVAFRLYYRRITSLLALLSMPISAFFFVASKPLVEVVLGSRWLGAAPIFSILAFPAFIQAPLSLNGLVQLSLGRGTRYFQIGAVSAVLVSIGFCVGVGWGAPGVAVSYGVITYASFIPLLAWGFHKSPLCLRDFFSSISRPAMASVTAAVAASGLRWLLPEAASTTVLASCAMVFASVYLAVMSCLPSGRAELHWVLKTLNSSLRGQTR